MDDAKYHSRLSEKMLTMNFKNDMISFMTKYHVEIASPFPVKPALLEKICEVNIVNKYVINEMATGYSVLVCHPIIVYLTQLE